MSEQDFIPEEEPRENDPLFKERKVEKQHNDHLGSITWALILIWAGMVFLAAQLGWLDALRTSISLPEGIYIAEMSTWSVIFLGSGVLVFIEAMIRSFSKTYRSSTGGNFVLAAVFLGIGLGSIFGWNAVWPFVLIAMGFAALLGALIRR
ncbi:hypothetical protein JR338_08840 [Chloroflexota bacterium]|nr:hypothetical protein JR338_08840 [Chloroflexota bacterium]